MNEVGSWKVVPYALKALPHPRMEDETLNLVETIDRSSYYLLKWIQDPRSLISLLGTSREIRRRVLDGVTHIRVSRRKGVRDNLIFLLSKVRTVRGTIVLSETSSIHLLDRQIRGSLVLFSRIRCSEDEKKMYGVFLSIFQERERKYPTSSLEFSTRDTYGNPRILLGFHPRSKGYTIRLRASKFRDYGEIQEVLRGATKIHLLEGTTLFTPKLYDTIYLSKASVLQVESVHDLAHILERCSRIRREPCFRSIRYPSTYNLLRIFRHSFVYPYSIEFLGYVCRAPEIENISRTFPRLYGSMGICVRESYERRDLPVSSKELVSFQPLEVLTPEERRILRKAKMTLPRVSLTPYFCVRVERVI